MGERFILILGATPEAPLRWGRFADALLIEGGWLESAEGLGQLSELAQNADAVIALLPGEEVAARRMAASPRGAAKARAAALYLMEDELGEPAEALHVAVGNGIAVAVRTAIVEAWREAFVAANFDYDILSADYLALDALDDGATIIAEAGRVVAAFDGAGFAAELSMFEPIAPALFSEAPLRIRLVGDRAIERLLPAESLVEHFGEADDARILSLYGEAVAKSLPTNLLQGSFEKKRALAPAIAPWRRAGSLAAAAAVLFVAGVIVDGVRAEVTANRWVKATHNVHVKRFPEAAKTDPVTYARQVLAQQGDASFLALSSRFADALKKNDAVQIDRIRYDAPKNEYIVSIRSRTDGGIEDLKAALSELGVVTQDTGGYRRTGASWSGELSARLQ